MTIAVLVSSLEEGSETFVKQHIKLLGEDVKVFYGGLTPFICRDDIERTSPTKIEKAHFRLLKILRLESDIRQFLLRKLIKRYNIKCCYAEFGPVGVGALSVCAKTDTKLIVNFHGYDIFRHDIVSEYREEYQKLFRYSSKIVSVSHSMTRQLVSLGCEESKIVYLPCTPNPDFLSVNYNPSAQKILFVGRFVEKKGAWLTILAFQKVLLSFPDSSLLMAGDGPLLGVCKSLVEALEIDNVKFLGSVTHKDVMGLFGEAMIYAQHSIIASNGDREGTPVSVMEAMLSGVPVVSTYHEGIAEIIQDGSDGLLCEEKDVSGMADAMVRLLASLTLRGAISEQSRKKMIALVESQDFSGTFSEYLG